jgi:LysM repeat protein
MSRSTRVVAAVALAAATLTLSVTTAEATPPGTYTVVSGDSLFGISQKLRVRFNDLLSANGLTASSVILPGQTLTVPGASPAPAAPASGGSYTVKAGDSLGRIATRHGVTLSALLAVNNMTATSLILPGQVLSLPAGATASAGTGGAPASPAAAAPSGATYAVVAGDSLGRIASRHGVSLQSLLAVNAMTVRSLILPGQLLQLPSGAASPSTPTPAANAPAAGGTYTVKAGDSLGRIATRHGVTLSALLAVNNMSASSLILPGQVISVPAGATAPPAQPTDTTSSSAGIAKVIEFALAQQGKPYAFATSGPDTYDCSGLTRRAYAQIGVSLIHQSAAQAQQGRAVAFTSEPIQAGDLVFMAPRGNDVISHVGIALSQTEWIQARRPGEVVRVGPMPALSSIVAVRRFV